MSGCSAVPYALALLDTPEAADHLGAGSTWTVRLGSLTTAAPAHAVGLLLCGTA